MKSSQNAAEANGAVTVDLFSPVDGHSADLVPCASSGRCTNIKELLDDDSLL